MTYIKVIMTNKETGYDEVIDIKAENAETALEIAQDDYSNNYKNFKVVSDIQTFQLWNRDYINGLSKYEAPEGEPNAVFNEIETARETKTPDTYILKVYGYGEWDIVE